MAAPLKTTALRGTQLHELKGRWIEVKDDESIFVRIEDDPEERSKLQVIITHENERVELHLWQGEDQATDHFLLGPKAANPIAAAAADAEAAELPDIVQLEKHGASWALNIIDPTTHKVSMQWQATEDREVEARTPKVIARKSGGQLLERRWTLEGQTGSPKASSGHKKACFPKFSDDEAEPEGQQEEEDKNDDIKGS